MTAAHIDGVYALECACFAHPWSHDSLARAADDPQSLFWVATENGAVRGYIGMNYVLDEGYIYNIAVDAAYRCRGVGTALLQTLVTHCKKHGFAFVTLEVRESNAPARALYSRFGFIKVGERRNYYTDPTENAVLMTLYF